MLNFAKVRASRFKEDKQENRELKFINILYRIMKGSTHFRI